MQRPRLILAIVCFAAAFAFILVKFGLPAASRSWKISSVGTDGQQQDPSRFNKRELPRVVPARVWPRSAAARVALTPDPLGMEELGRIVLAKQWESLTARAEREPAFAYTLASTLHECAQRDQTYRSIEGRLKTLSAERVAASLAKAEARFAKCDGLSADQIDARFEMVERAARAGVLEAQIEYQGMVRVALNTGSALRTPGAVDRMRANAVAFAEAAARSGDSRGIYQAFEIYSLNFLVPRDNVRAYQYALAYSRVRPGLTANTMLSGLEQRMSPDELARARASRP
ncbi:MAG: hypothetical protein ABIP44_07200 [Pseudoxanthomonas sp.]